MPKTHLKKNIKPLSDDELEQIKVVFHQFETGVRSGTIRPGVADITKYFQNMILIKIKTPRSFRVKPILPNQSVSEALPNPLPSY